MSKNLLILGAGQYGMVAKEIAESMDCFDKIDFLDDNNEMAIGKLSDYKRLAVDYQYAFVAIGNSKIRMELIEQLGPLYEIPILIHPKTYISPTAKLGKGCIVEPMAVVQRDTWLKDGVIVSAGAVINHNSTVEAGCHINCGAIIASGVKVPAETHIECGQVYD
ncbi:MAG TPA: PglB [Oscillospiraceae bacterium]|nr:PglB [Oscillospiraceae bacterium]HPS35106.1 PglB [Oscillospiraceae bacterium]